MVIEQCDELVRVTVPTLERVIIVKHPQRLLVVQPWACKPIAKTSVINESGSQGCAQGEIEYRIEVMVVLILQELADILFTFNNTSPIKATSGYSCVLLDISSSSIDVV